MGQDLSKWSSRRTPWKWCPWASDLNNQKHQATQIGSGEFQDKERAKALRQAHLGRCEDRAGSRVSGWMVVGKEARTGESFCCRWSDTGRGHTTQDTRILRAKTSAALLTRRRNHCRAHTPAACSEGLTLQTALHLPRSDTIWGQPCVPEPTEVLPVGSLDL